MWSGLILLVGLAAGAPGPGQQETNQVTSITEIVTAGNPAALAGRRADLSNVRVEQVLNEQVVLLSGPMGRTLVMRREESKPPLRKGQALDVTGVLNQMPVTTQGWNLPGNASGTLRGHSVFLSAIRVRQHQLPRQKGNPPPSHKPAHAGAAVSVNRPTNRS